MNTPFQILKLFLSESLQFLMFGPPRWLLVERSPRTWGILGDGHYKGLARDTVEWHFKEPSLLNGHAYDCYRYRSKFVALHRLWWLRAHNYKHRQYFARSRSPLCVGISLLDPASFRSSCHARAQLTIYFII